MISTIKEIVNKTHFAQKRKVAVLALCIVLAGSSYFCGKKDEEGNGECLCKEDGYMTSILHDHFWYLNDEKRYFEISSKEVVVIVGEKVTENDLERFFLENNSLQVCEVSEMRDNGFTLVRFNDCNRKVMKKLTSQLKTNDTILFVGQVIIDEYGRNTSAITNQINVRLREDSDFNVLQEAVASYDIGKIEQGEWTDSRTYLLIVNYFSKKSALQIANELHETGLFEYAGPNLILYIRYY